MYSSLVLLFALIGMILAVPQSFNVKANVKLHGPRVAVFGIEQEGDKAKSFHLPPTGLASKHFAGPITIKSTSTKENQIDLKLCLQQEIVPTHNSLNTDNWAAQCTGYAMLHNGTSQETTLIAAHGRMLAAAGRGDGGSGFVPSKRGLAKAMSKRAALAVEDDVVVAAAGDNKNFEQVWSPRVGQYYLAVAAAKVVPANNNYTINLQMQGHVCDAANSQKFGLEANKACSISTVQLKNNSTTGSSFTSGAQYWQLDADARSLISDRTSKLTVTVQQDGTKDEGVLQLWARWGNLPQNADGEYDAFDQAKDSSSAATIEVTAPQANADWFIGVANNGTKTTTHYNITLLVHNCPVNQTGNPCAETNHLSSAEASATTFTVKQGMLTVFTLPQGIEAAVGAAAVNEGDPKPKLYLRWNQPPSETEFDFVDCTLTSCTDANVIMAMAPNTTENRNNGQWYGAVAAGEAQQQLVVGDDSGYDVIVWNAHGENCANKCSGHGTCDKDTLTCSCEGSFGTADCAVAVTLKTWEWALIIGGGVLVAIGLIGCIVYFIQKQQRRSGFERV